MTIRTLDIALISLKKCLGLHLFGLAAVEHDGG